MEKRAVKAEKQRDDALDKITLQRREIYRLGIELDRKKTGCPDRTQRARQKETDSYRNSYTACPAGSTG